MPFSQHQDTELWNNQFPETKILGLPVSGCMHGLVYMASRDKVDEDTFHKGIQYSAAQICPNQNIRVMRVSPIRVYAYAYTHVRVCIYAHTRIQYIHICLIGMYELTYCFFFSSRSLLFSMA